MPILTLYSRPGCHLCEEMLTELTSLAPGARIDVIDISEDGALMQAYGLSIPVLMHGDQELARYRLDPERIRDYLARQPS